MTTTHYDTIDSADDPSLATKLDDARYADHFSVTPRFDNDGNVTGWVVFQANWDAE